MSFNQQVQNSYDIMSKNLASAQAEMIRRRRMNEMQRSKDLVENVSQNSQIFGKFLVNGAGEAYKDVLFPVTFSNVPVVTFGIEVKSKDNLVWTSYEDDGTKPVWSTSNEPPGIPAGQSGGLIAGSAPIVTAAAYDWMTDEDIPANGGVPVGQRYTGVRVLTVCDGPVSTKFIVHWSAAGIAYMNPTGGAMQNGFKEAQEQLMYATVQWQPGSSGWYEGGWYRGDETPPGYTP